VAGNSARSAVQLLAQADQLLGVARREILRAARGEAPGNVSTPLLMHVAAVPLHWQLTDRAPSAAWSPNALVGGDFEDLQFMSSAGWTNQRSADEQFTTHVQLSPTAAIQGRRGLLLDCQIEPGAARGEPSHEASVRITSAEVPVEAGQLLRIHGWVQVEGIGPTETDGLVIADTLGGEDLALHINGTPGWQEFSLYRGTNQSGKMQLIIELRGTGRAMIDEVTVRAMEARNDLRNAEASDSAVTGARK
jgi:hypothetical protein